MAKLMPLFLTLVVGVILVEILPYSCKGNEKKTQPVSAPRCLTDDECDNGKACDGPEFCSQGTCQSTERSPCANGEKYCVNAGKNDFICQQCRYDGDCGINQYCNHDDWQCVPSP